MTKAGVAAASTGRMNWIPWAVWALRVVIGATFAVSGLAKSIDIWGFSFKIEEYFTAWNVMLPPTLYVIAAMGLSAAEFILGAMLMLGCYKRSSVVLLLLLMCGMLPLTLYIYIAEPVADCGCFGDFLKISNGATFVKNLVLTAALLILVKYNRKVVGLFSPYCQWMVGVVCLVYVVTVGLWGYNVQPLVDFRSFPVGSDLLTDDESGDVTFDFIYEKDGVREVFTSESLPDSTWTFVDRQIVGVELEQKTELSIYDDGENVTEDVISTDSPQMIIVVPDYRKAGISYTYAINELQHMVEDAGGTLMELVAMPDDEIERWRDLSMATYPIYQAEPTVLKELARGIMGAVYAVDGKIVWKRTLSSIDPGIFSGRADSRKMLDSLSIDGPKRLLMFTGILVGLLVVIFVADKCVSALKGKRHNRAKSKKMSNFALGNQESSDDIR